MVIDFRDLNQRTAGDAYPLPNITDILDQLGGAMYFSVFDLASGFHQIKMDPEDQWKTAFSIPNGHYEYTRMTMGLKNAPATFQRLMDQIKRGLDCKEMLVYMDDVIIHTNSLKEHDKRVRKFLNRLALTQLVLQPEKVHFLRKEVAFLGHIVSERGRTRPGENKSRERVSATQWCQKHPGISRTDWLLSPFYSRLRENCQTLARIIEKG